MTALWFLLVFSVAVYGFWSVRRHEEWATQVAKAQCQRLQLQWLSTARIGLKPVWQRGLQWHYCYEVECSSDGQDRFTATMVMIGMKLQGFDTPVYKEPGARHLH